MESHLRLALTKLLSCTDRPFLRQTLKQLADGLLAGVAWWIADQLWFGSDWTIRRTLVWVLISSVVGGSFQLTSQYYRFAGLRDATRLGLATLALLGSSLFIKFLSGPLQLSPEVASIASAASVLTGLFWGTLRVAWRVWYEARDQQLFTLAGNQDGRCHPTLVVGAGQAGAIVLQELARHPDLGFRVVGIRR